MLTAHTMTTPAGPIIKLFIPSTYARLVPDALGIENCGSADQVPLVRANLLLFQAAQRSAAHGFRRNEPDRALAALADCTDALALDVLKKALSSGQSIPQKPKLPS
jgi:hypothetical protein